MAKLKLSLLKSLYFTLLLFTRYFPSHNSWYLKSAARQTINTRDDLANAMMIEGCLTI